MRLASETAEGVRRLRPSPVVHPLQARFSRAGVELDGPHPWDPRIRRWRALARVTAEGSLGAGESYVDGDWDCDALDELTARLIAADVDPDGGAGTALVGRLLGRLLNRQSPRRAARNGRAHYDRGNELYRAMLGPTLAYSCGYWRDARTLDEAQEAKHELICRKLSLAPGLRLLDVGCGWGAFARHAASRHGVRVLGLTVSPAQAEVARRRCAGLPVQIELGDYRQLRGDFDRVVSIEMFEHVGDANYRTFFRTVRRVLAPGGLLLLHTIGGHRSSHRIEPFIDRHVFPGAVLPSAAQIARAAEGLWVLEDWHNFGADYDRTLLAWAANFEAAWPDLRPRFGDRFFRLWRYYLLTCAGSFRARRNHAWQIVFSDRGVPGGYRRVGE